MSKKRRYSSMERISIWLTDRVLPFHYQVTMFYAREIREQLAKMHNLRFKHVNGGVQGEAMFDIHKVDAVQIDRLLTSLPDPKP